MEIRSINNRKKEIVDYLRLNWVFEKSYEKIFLILLCMLGVWKAIDIIKTFL